jgi:ribonuclease P protein component
LRRSSEFAATLRAGRRRPGGARPALLIVSRADGTDSDGTPAQAGFIVARSVGGAVVRNRVRRRLRHLLAPRLATLPPGTRVVVRALPPAATATSDQLGAALDQAMTGPVAGRVPDRRP